MTVDVTPAYRAGEGPPLVLLHGAGMSWRAWTPVLGELQRHHELFVPTMTGHRGGGAWVPGAPAGIDTIVDAVCDQLDRAGIESPHVAGNSLGGWVALELARRGRARSCVALSPAGSWRHRLDLQRLVWTFHLGLALVRTPGLRLIAAHPWTRRPALRHVMEHGERLTPDEVVGLLDDMRACAILGPLLAVASTHGPLAAFPSSSCRVRVAWAERDRVVPYRGHGAAMRRIVPAGTEFVRLPGCGHVPMWDDPALVAATILQVTADGGRPATRAVG